MEDAVVTILGAYDLAGHIDGSLPAPSTDINGDPNPAFLAWTRRDQLVLSWIISSVSENLLSQIVDADTAQVAWQKLASAYASRSQAQIRSLKIQLSSLSRGIDLITDYMQRAKHIANQLVALNASVSDDDVYFHITQGLGPTFHPFIHALEARNASLTFDDVYASLT